MAMEANLSPSRLRMHDAAMLVRWLLGWQSLEFDGRMRCGTLPLNNLQPGEFIFFTC
jgi:hypothetical protein